MITKEMINMVEMTTDNQMADLLGEETQVSPSTPPLPVEMPLDDLNIEEDDAYDFNVIEEDVEEAPPDELIPDLIRESMYSTEEEEEAKDQLPCVLAVSCG